MTVSVRQRAFTIPEMLVVVTLFTIIGTVVAALFTRGNSAYRHGETHIEMQRYGRQVINRITPHASSMFDGRNPSALPIVAPPPDPALQTQTLTFYTTEDWLSLDYPSPTTSSTQVLDQAGLRNLRFVYQIRYDNPSKPGGGSGDVLLERLNPATFDVATFDPNDPSTYAVTNSRVLVRRKVGETLKNFRFTRVRSTLVVLEFETEKETRSDANQPILINEKFRATFNLPSKSV